MKKLIFSALVAIVIFASCQNENKKVETPDSPTVKTMAPPPPPVQSADSTTPPPPPVESVKKTPPPPPVEPKKGKQ